MAFGRRGLASAAIGAALAAVGIKAARAEAKPAHVIMGRVRVQDMPDRLRMAYLGAIREIYPDTIAEWVRDGKISRNEARYLAGMPHREAQVRQLRARLMTREQLRAMESVPISQSYR